MRYENRGALARFQIRTEPRDEDIPKTPVDIAKGLVEEQDFGCDK